MNKELLIFFSVLFIPATSLGQSGDWYIYESNGGLCNQSIVLFKDGVYNYERGCEGSSRFSFGNWIQKRDTIIFTEANNKTFKVIRGVISKKIDNKNLTVKIYDNLGQNITERISVGQSVKGKGSYILGLDSTKTIRFDLKRDSGTIVIRSLQRFTGQKLEIKTDSSNYYEITLNISKDWIFHNNSDWGGNGNFKLLKTEQGISSLKPDSIDDKGNLVKTIFKWQKG